MTENKEYKMKKFLVVILVATLALAMTSCASTGGGGDAAPRINLADQFWFITREEGGMAARNNQVNLLPGDTYVYIYFRKSSGLPGANFDTIRIDFEAAEEVGIFWQAAYQEGAVWGSEVEVGVMDKGSIETDCSVFVLPWYTWSDSMKSLDKDQMTGLCLKVNSPGRRALFTVTDVVFVGLEGAE
jgi:hypothetical protein